MVFNAHSVPQEWLMSGTSEDQERELKIFERRILEQVIFRRKREKVMDGYKRLINHELIF